MRFRGLRGLMFALALASVACSHAPTRPTDDARIPTVLLRLHVDAHGAVKTAEVVQSSDPKLDETAQQKALTQLHFKPAVRDGQPVESDVRYQVTFVPQR